MNYKSALFLTIFCFFTYFEALADKEFLESPDVAAFSDMMVTKHGFTAEEMKELFDMAKYLETPAKSSDKPAEALDWVTYHSRMITSVKIKQGLKYYNKHRTDLRRAESIYGIPDYLIAGILGIETNFGTYPLRYRAVDALASLAFFYPRRAKYFQDELEALLVYAKSNKTDPFTYSSSYAGAIGIPQFMPSNMAKYAVDADLDGKADIIKNHKDAIYSVGNFLKEHKWQKGQPIVTEVRLKGEGYTSVIKDHPCGKNSMTTVGALKKAGVIFDIKVASAQKASLFPLETPDGLKYYVGFENLCVIHRYNPSLRYSMVINSLGAEIGKKKSAKQTAKIKK